jgi:ABC-type glycerol-3-phosphate transport system substrate-binding protein
LSRFQIIFITLLVIFAVAGIAVFALSKNTGSFDAPQTVMWGTFDSALMSSFLSDVSTGNRKTVNVTYVEKSASSFESDLIAALARGSGPDLVLVPQDFVLKQADKFYPIPFSTYSERDFKDAFVEEGELYLTSEGAIGFPFSIDPMVMYWNRDMFVNAGVSTPPRSWTEFASLVPKITKRDSSGNITQSLVSFGEVRNVEHAKDIVALLSIQAGTPIVSRDTRGGLSSVFAMQGSALSPGEEAVRFFTEFANPVKSLYSWNRSLPTARASFVSGRLALYFGYASELASIRASNPNLNFDIAEVPQTGGRSTTFGHMNAIAILKSSPNISAAYLVVVTLTSSPVISQWVAKSGLPPVRRDLLSTVPSDAYRAVFYRGALLSKAWLDPNREGSDAVFMRLVENVTSGRLLVSEAVRTSSLELDGLLRANQ